MVSTRFLDAVQLVTTYLRLALAAEGYPVPVVGLVPNPRPDVFVLVRRLGGSTANLVTDRPSLSVEAYAPSEGLAMDLAQMSRALLLELPGQVLAEVPVYRVDEVAGPATLPDPESATPRVTITMDIWLRGKHPTA
jgi:hypothetical protein